MLGDVAGAPDILPYAEEVYKYFRLLAASSPRVKVFTIGKSEEGREMIAAAIADPELLKSAKENSARLAQLGVIVGGKIMTCGMDLGGALGVTLHMDSHTTKDFQVNFHKKWWVPIDLTIPIGLGNMAGIPFSVTFNMMLDVNSGFSAKQSILTAEGDYTYTGGLWAGYKAAGGWQLNPVSDVTARTDMGRSIQGVSVGINSLVLAASIRAMVGIGAFGFNTGVFIGMRFDGTLLRAPDIAFPCRQATIEVFLDSGVGYSLPGFVVKVINDLLSLFAKYQIDRVGTILKGPSDRLFHGNTQIPAACATPKGGGS